MSPRFSVVIPLYNKAGHIVNTIKSVLAQNFRDFEIIVVDDGSTDGGADLVKSFNETKIRLFIQKNCGVSVARNRGVAESSAEFIAFLDADDEWYPWHLEEMESLIQKFPQYGLFSVAHDIIRNEKKYRPSTGVEEGFCGVISNIFKTFGSGLSLINSSTACVNRKVFNQSGGFPVGITKGEDVYLWLKIGLSDGIAHSARSCAIYYKEVPARSNVTKTSEIPYYFIYLADLISNTFLTNLEKKSAKKLLFNGILFTAAGYKLDGNLAGLSGLKNFIVVKKSFTLRFIFILLELIPHSVLLRLRALRHARI
jgi:glycosyltransferase involved in cell wall biosynthesis